MNLGPFDPISQITAPYDPADGNNLLMAELALTRSDDDRRLYRISGVSFTPSKVHRGGSLRWGVHELQLSAATKWRERYALADHGCELAVFDAKSWGKRPVKIVIDNPGLVQPGLVLFAAFTVRQLAADADATAASAAGTASTS